MIQVILPTHKLVIFTKFHWIKIVDSFLLKWPVSVPVTFLHQSLYHNDYNQYLLVFLRSEIFGINSVKAFIKFEMYLK